MQQVHAVFFSPTGTTRKTCLRVAQTVSDLLQLPLAAEDITRPEKRRTPLAFGPEDIVVIALPTYAGRLPNLLLPYLETLRGDRTPAVPLVLFGNRSPDDSLPELGLLLEAQGFWLMAAAAFVGEHAFSRELGAGRPDRRDMRKIDAFAEAAAQKLRDGAPRRSLWELLGEAERPLKPYYTPRDRRGNPINILKVKPRVDPAKCLHCGRCVTLCPMGSIRAEELPQIGGVCIKCGACEKGCPAGAVYFDDPGYLYHRSELEAQYARRAPVQTYL